MAGERHSTHVESHGQSGGITAGIWPPTPPLLSLRFEDGCWYTVNGTPGVNFPDGLKIQCPHGLETSVQPGKLA